MCNFTLRRITSLLILSCILVVTFVTTFLHFHGPWKLTFTESGAVFHAIPVTQLEEPSTLESASYAGSDEDDMMRELLSPSPPDLYPTPRRPRRGTPDGTFGSGFGLLCIVIINALI